MQQIRSVVRSAGRGGGGFLGLPFFKEDGQLGTDIHLREARPSGGVQASNSPGLYGGAPNGSNGSGSPAPGTGIFGGSTQPGTCAVAKLKKFLTDRKNSAKAQEWARVLEISTDQIPSYIDQLTPVVLRHDTLVTNHDYKHGKAVPYAALLQAGIAIMVDKDGLPAVKCSCGNPLRPFEGKASKTDVQFKNGNKKWADYRQDRVVVVKPPPGEHEILKLQLVDVHHPDRGIARPVGSDGNQDTSFSTQQKHAVPAVSGLTFAEAIRRLTDAGLGMTYTGDALPADDARVTASQPAEGSEVAWGTSVVLSVRSDSPSDAGGGQATPSDSGGTSAGPGTTPPTAPPATTPSTPSTGTSGDSSGPSSSNTSTGGTSSSDGGTGSSTPSHTSTEPSTPTDTSGGTDGGTSSSTPSHASPTSTDLITPSASVSTEPPPKPSSTKPTTEPSSTKPTVSSAPPASRPVSSDPAPVDPGTSDSPPGDPPASVSGGPTESTA